MIKVLLVDDETAICEGMKQLIEETDADFRVVATAYDGEEALKQLSSAAPDVLITDMKMPQMDGLELIREAKRQRPDLVAAIISAYSDYIYIREALQLHVDDYVLKPVTAADLQDMLLRLKLIIRKASGQLSVSTGTHDTGERIPPAVRQMEIFLQEHYREPITLQMLSDALGLAPKYAGALFKREKGITPIEYLTWLRMEKAKAMMRSSPVPLLKQVALEIGYTDPFYFSRVFKKYIGQSPSDYMQGPER